MLTFNFATTTRIVFGSGRFAELGKLAAEFGRRAALVTGAHWLEASGRLDALSNQFDEQKIAWTRLTIAHEPTVEAVDAMTRAAREFGADVVIAVGGGSVIDTAKAVAALLANGGETLDYLEGVGRGKPVTVPSLPFIAVPTTAGTGAEATNNAVISDAARTFKRSMRSDKMLARVALVDPELTLDCPPEVTAACGLDTLAQLIESFTSRRANPLIDAWAGLGLGLAGDLPRLAREPDNLEAREEMALASLLSGVCLSNAGLGAVHGLASPLGAFYPIPHGVVCGALLPAVVRLNAEKAATAGDDWLLEKYCAAALQLIELEEEEHGEIEAAAQALLETEKPAEALAVAQALADYLGDLRERLGLRGLGAYGVREADFARIIAGARGGSMRTNPVDLSDEDLARVLREAL